MNVGHVYISSYNEETKYEISMDKELATGVMELLKVKAKEYVDSEDFDKAYDCISSYRKINNAINEEEENDGDD